MTDTIKIRILICKYDYDIPEEVLQEYYVIFKTIKNCDQIYVVKDVFSNNSNRNATIIEPDEMFRRIKRYME